MDLQLFVAINILALAALAVVITVVQRPRGYLSWVLINAAVIAVAGLALAYDAERAGAIAAAAYVPLVLTPLAFGQMAQRQSMMGRYGDALWRARIAALFHPSADARFNVALLGALDASETRDDPGPLAELGETAAPERRAMIAAMAARSRGDWRQVADIARGAGRARGDLASLEIRALGELGRGDEMVALFQRMKPALAGYNLVFGQLFVLAFGGRRAAVARLLSGQLKFLDADARTYWLGIAALNAPDGRGEGRALMQQLAAHARLASARHAAERHLAGHDGDGPAVLAPDAEAVVAATETQVARNAHVATVRPRDMRLTLLLVAVNCAAFVAEDLAGGSEDMDALVRLGALWPPLVLRDGEWWRLLTPSFLHFGPVHLFANMAMLYLLGRVVERTLGWPALLVGYLAGGVGSTAAVLELMREHVIGYGTLVGASGAIFALFGMIAARAVVDWRRSRDVLDRRRLVLLGLVMAVQFTIDVSVPQISFAAHASGLLVGFLLGLVWRERPPVEA